VKGKKGEKRRRPFGVYALIVLWGLQIISLLFFASFADRMQMEFGLPVHLLGRITTGSMLAFIFGISALLLAITAVGLWMLKRWAWVATMVLVGIGLFTGIWQVLLGRPLDISLLFNVIVVFYLNSREVQNAFSRRTPVGANA
jgi:uncharacterized membrane protein (DUF2068 family)